jgi:hypothetical protein
MPSRKRTKDKILYLGKKLPPLWMRREIQKWKTAFGLRELGLNIYHLSCKQMNKKFGDGENDIVGHAAVLPEYLFARLYFSSTLKNDNFGRQTVFHEVRHVYYELLFKRLRDIETLIAPSKQEAFNRVLASLVEEMIERDILLYCRNGKV